MGQACPACRVLPHAHACLWGAVAAPLWPEQVAQDCAVPDNFCCVASRHTGQETNILVHDQRSGGIVKTPQDSLDHQIMVPLMYVWKACLFCPFCHLSTLGALLQSFTQLQQCRLHLHHHLCVSCLQMPVCMPIHIPVHMLAYICA